MGVADFGPRRSRAFPRRFPGTRDEATVRGKILYPWEARTIMDFIEEHETKDLADAGDRLEQIQGLGVVVLGRFDDGEFDVAKQRIVVADEGEIDFNAFLHGRIGKTFSDPVAIGFIGNLFTDRRQVILAVGILHVRQEFPAFACQVHASAQQITGCAHLGGVDIGLREHTTTQKHRNFMRVDFVVFRLATVDGLHIEGMTEDKRDTMFRTEVGKLVPGKHAFGRQDDLFPVGGDRLEQRLWGGGHIPVHQCFSSLVEDTDVHGTGVEIDAAVKRVLLGVESH